MAQREDQDHGGLEQALTNVLHMVASAIRENRFNDSKRQLFLDYLVNVTDWSKLTLADP